MPDREKVIKGMELCISPNDECSPDNCPYYVSPNNESGLCWNRLMADALAMMKEQEEEIENLKQTAQSMMEGVCLLKEQEAVKPINSYGTFRCGNCRNIVGYKDGHGCGYQNNFCSKCGKAVKWK